MTRSAVSRIAQHRAPVVAAGVAFAIVSASSWLGCAPSEVRPASIDTANDQCASCRMIVSDQHFAAQIAAPGEEPRFFDDLGCLRDGLRSSGPLPHGAVVFVADHRTGAWVRADLAVFVRLAAVDTPMASHWAAYASDASRRADPAAAEATPVAADAVLGGGSGPGGTEGGAPR
jgi:copper chaperone NosL